VPGALPSSSGPGPRTRSLWPGSCGTPFEPIERVNRASRFVRPFSGRCGRSSWRGLCKRGHIACVLLRDGSGIAVGQCYIVVAAVVVSKFVKQHNK
jgi:hypothetical protein